MPKKIMKQYYTKIKIFVEKLQPMKRELLFNRFCLKAYLTLIYLYSDGRKCYIQIQVTMPLTVFSRNG